MENLSIIITFAAYLFFMLGVGAHFCKRNESLSDYLIGDRQLTHPIIEGMLLAAIMSTADSQQLVTSSALTEDLYRVIIRPAASEKELVWVSRGTVITLAAAACLMALKPESSG